MGDWGKVFVATRYQPYLPAQTCESLSGLAVSGLRPGDVRDFVYSKTMHKGANILARRFLASACDSMCFIDSDAVFGAPALGGVRSDAGGGGGAARQAFPRRGGLPAGGGGRASAVPQASSVKRGWAWDPMYVVAMPNQPQSVEGRRGRH